MYHVPSLPRVPQPHTIGGPYICVSGLVFVRVSKFKNTSKVVCPYYLIIESDIVERGRISNSALTHAPLNYGLTPHSERFSNVPSRLSRVED